MTTIRLKWAGAAALGAAAAAVLIGAAGPAPEPVLAVAAIDAPRDPAIDAPRDPAIDPPRDPAPGALIERLAAALAATTTPLVGQARPIGPLAMNTAAPAGSASQEAEAIAAAVRAALASLHAAASEAKVAATDRTDRFHVVGVTTPPAFRVATRASAPSGWTAASGVATLVTLELRPLPRP